MNKTDIYLKLKNAIDNDSKLEMLSLLEELKHEAIAENTKGKPLQKEVLNLFKMVQKNAKTRQDLRKVNYYNDNTCMEFTDGFIAIRINGECKDIDINAFKEYQTNESDNYPCLNYCFRINACAINDKINLSGIDKMDLKECIKKNEPFLISFKERSFYVNGKYLQSIINIFGDKEIDCWYCKDNGSTIHFMNDNIHIIIVTVVKNN